jgi:hypothetical protein
LSGLSLHEVTTDLVLVSGAQEDDPSEDAGSDSEVTFGGGILRLTFNGGSLAKRCIRSSFMALAFSSVNPGLRSPATFDEKEERSRVA